MIAFAMMMSAMAAQAQIGQPWIHDPSTLVECDGKYCIYSVADSTPTLAEYDFNSDNSKWNFRK